LVRTSDKERFKGKSNKIGWLELIFGLSFAKKSNITTHPNSEVIFVRK